jgi:hypothetical protein
MREKEHEQQHQEHPSSSSSSSESLEVRSVEAHEGAKERCKQLKHLAHLAMEVGKAYHGFGKDLNKVATQAKSYLVSRKAGAPGTEPVDRWMHALVHLAEALAADSDRVGDVCVSDTGAGGVVQQLLLAADELQGADRRLGGESARVLAQLRDSQAAMDRKSDERDRYREKVQAVGREGVALPTSSAPPSSAAGSSAAAAASSSAQHPVGTLQKVIGMASHLKQQAEEEVAARVVHKLQTSELALLDHATAHGDLEREVDKVLPKVLLGYRHSTDHALKKTRGQLAAVVAAIRTAMERSNAAAKQFEGRLAPTRRVGYEAELRRTLEHLRDHTASPVSVADAGTPAAATATGAAPWKMDMNHEGTAVLAATSPSLLPPLPPAFRGAVERESCVWFNAFFGRVYRDASASEHFRAWLLDKLTTMLNKNSKNRPGFLDEFRVVDVSFGETPPLLLNMQWSPKVTAAGSTAPEKEKSPGKSANDDDSDDDDDEDDDGGASSKGGAAAGPSADDDDDDEVACTADFAFRSGLKFQMATTVWINWPRDRSASIPVTLDLEVCAHVVYARRARRPIDNHPRSLPSVCPCSSWRYAVGSGWASATRTASCRSWKSRSRGSRCRAGWATTRSRSTTCRRCRTSS